MNGTLMPKGKHVFLSIVFCLHIVDEGFIWKKAAQNFSGFCYYACFDKLECYSNRFNNSLLLAALFFFILLRLKNHIQMNSSSAII